MLDPRVAKAYSKLDLSQEETEELWSFIISGCTPAPAPAQEDSGIQQDTYSEPAYEERYEAPVHEQPVYDEPAQEEPVYDEPAPEQIIEEPVEELPSETEYRESAYDDLPPLESEEKPVRRSHSASRTSRTSHTKSRTSRKHRKPQKPVLIAVTAVLLVALIVAVIVLNGRGRAEDAKTSGVTSGGTGFVSASGAKESYSRSAVAIPQADDLSSAISYNGPADAMEKIEKTQQALDEWNSWKREKQQAYFEANMPSLAAFLMRDGEFDGTDVTPNGDATYTLTHWSFGEDTASSAIDPITGQLIGEITKVPDTGSAVTVQENEYLRYQKYTESQLTQGYYGDYYYIYEVRDEEDGAKLDEIAAKYSLKLRKEAGTSAGYGEEDDAALHKKLSAAVSEGDVFALEPEIDHFAYFSNGSFQSVADLYLKDARRMYTLMSYTHYDEMIDGRVVGGFTVSNPGTMNPRSYTAADGTVLTVSQNSEQAIVYAYLDNGYVVLDMSIDPWRVRPVNEPDSMTIAKRESNLTLTEEDVNYILDAINFQKLK